MESQNNISIIIPYHNEGKDFLLETIKSIKDSVKSNYEIIIIDDLSDEELVLSEAHVSVIRHKENKGVGQAFDTGVELSKYNDLILMGCDMRFEDNGWAELIINEINEYPKSIVCTPCVNYKPNISFDESIVYWGADMLTRFERRKTIFEAKWILEKKQNYSYEIPCILGACYGIKKDWYNYIDGWWGHVQWGTLEPYISMKTRLFGGSCRIVPDAKTGHIFKDAKSNFHEVKYTNIVFNKLLVSHLLLPDKLRDIMIDYVADSKLKVNSKIMIDNMRSELNIKRKEYADKTVYSEQEIQNMFNI